MATQNGKVPSPFAECVAGTIAVRLSRSAAVEAILTELNYRWSPTKLLNNDRNWQWRITSTQILPLGESFCWGFQLEMQLEMLLTQSYWSRIGDQVLHSKRISFVTLNLVDSIGLLAFIGWQFEWFWNQNASFWIQKWFERPLFPFLVIQNLFTHQ